MDKKELAVTSFNRERWEFGPKSNPRKYLLIEDEGLYKGEDDLRLKATALRVLTLLIRRARQKLSNKVIANAISDQDWQHDERRFAIEYVSQIRRAFDANEGKQAIKNDRSLGYHFAWKVINLDSEVLQPAPPTALTNRASLDLTSDTSRRTFISKLPSVNSTLFGRDGELFFLDQAWSNESAKFVQIIAAGGTGKTALVDKWFRRHVNETTIFGWSFYSQGVSENRQTTSVEFFAEIQSFFHIEVPETASIFTRAELIARHLRTERVLLILDGLEPLQESTGALRDTALKTLLRELATANAGMVLCTTRLRVGDIPDDMLRTLSLELENLAPEDGAKYLRHLGVRGGWDKLLQASADFGNHALALTLLGHYLVLFCKHWVRGRREIPAVIIDEVEHGLHARRVMRAYARMYENKPELDLLHAFGFFDRPIEPEILKLVLPSSLSETEYLVGLDRIRKARLIYEGGPGELLDCHPLIREHFADELSRSQPMAFSSGHSRIYMYYCEKAVPLPASLGEMTPLFYAVYHGARSGQHQKALEDVYRRRLLRGDEYYLSVKLGLFPTNISLLANFFELPWSQPIRDLSQRDQAWLFFQAAFSLRAVGRFTDAIRPFEEAARAAEHEQDLAKVAAIYGSLQGLHIALGNIQKSLECGRTALTFADRCGDRFQRMSKRTCVAEALHMAGDFAQAERLLNEAEEIFLDGGSQSGTQGGTIVYVHCNLLLDLGRCDEVIRRATEALKHAESRGDIRDMGLMHAMLGSANPKDSKPALLHLDQAVDCLHEAGSQTHLAYGLLARKKSRDLEEVFATATNFGMRLNLVDYHLAIAESTSQDDRTSAREHLNVARSLVSETGYHRRDSKLARLDHNSV